VAAPIGNPAAPALLEEGVFIPDTSWCEPKVSYLQDFTFNCKLSPHSAKCDSIAELGAITYSMFECLDLSLILGSGSNHLRVNDEIEFRTNGGLIWYGEGKLVLMEMKNTAIGLFGEGGGYNWMKGASSDLKMRFWSAGASITQRIGWFAPYLGVAVLHSRWKITRAEETYRFLQQKPTGLFLGFTLGNSKVGANAEWRVLMENALTLSLEMRF
jgi:hypothetical protein